MGLLLNLFGPRKREIWRQFASEIKGDYVEGGFFKGDKVQVKHKQWTITLDTYSQSAGESHVTYTRIRAPYVNKDGFRFTIHHKGLFSGLGKLLGKQDVEVGYMDFDDAFIIQGNDESKLRALFANPRIRELLEMQPKIYLTVNYHKGWWSPRFPEGVDELLFRATGVIKDLDRLRSLYYLFVETLNHLCHIGSAREDDPKLEL
jgi:hypothetical protein